MNAVTVSAAFLAEVREQWTRAREQLDRATAALDEWGLLEARGRLEDLEEILRRNDAPVGAVRI